MLRTLHNLLILGQKIKILEFDRSAFKIKARGFGETFRLDKHPQVKILCKEVTIVIESPLKTGH